LPRVGIQPLPLPRFCPLQRLSVAKIHFLPVGTHPAGSVASSGFLTLSTLYSLRNLPGLFHPGSALGVHPSRLSSSHGAVRPLERRAPLGLPVPWPMVRLPTGTHTPWKARTPGLEFSQVAGPRASLGFLAPRLLISNQGRVLLAPTVPSRAFPPRPQADRSVGTPGYHSFETQPLSLKTGMASLRFFTSLISLGSLEIP